MKPKLQLLFLMCFLMINALHLKADIIMPKVFSDNMVFQRGKAVNIWGKASVGEVINIQFGKQKVTTAANAEGNWAVKLKPMKANAMPQQLVVSGNNTLKFENILVGEVWIACGQSNMDYPLDIKLTRYLFTPLDYEVARKELDSQRNPLIRVLFVEKKFEEDISTKGWAVSNDTILKYVATPGYFFAKELAEKLKVPIGIISNAWAGTQIENWTPLWAYQESPVYSQKAKEPDFIVDTERPGDRFEHLMKPIIPYSVKGFLWYQGESNCMAHDSLRYTYKFKMFTDAYRKIWNDPKIPFYFVQIAPFRYSTLANTPFKQDEFLLPYTWEAQLKCLEIPYTGMVVTIDLVDNLENIHPGKKWEVGKRLSLWALAKDYGLKIAYSGPIYKKMEIKKNKIVLKFKYTGSRLVSIDNKPLTYFTIAGNDRKFYPANAIIKGRLIIVYSDKVQSPVAVRFAWTESAQPNFFNSDGLPASPFRTDSW